jgi:hypothetical protein
LHFFCRRLFNFFLLFFFLSLFIHDQVAPIESYIDAQCALGLKDIFTPEPPSRFGGRRQQATPEPSVWLAAASRLLIVSTTGAGPATGLTMAGGNNVEAEAPMGVLAGLRALGATGEYYAHPWKALVWACRALDASQGPVPARHAWLGQQVVRRSGDLPRRNRGHQRCL